MYLAVCYHKPHNGHNTLLGLLAAQSSMLDSLRFSASPGTLAKGVGWDQDGRRNGKGGFCQQMCMLESIHHFAAQPTPFLSSDIAGIDPRRSTGN